MSKLVITSKRQGCKVFYRKGEQYFRRDPAPAPPNPIHPKEMSLGWSGATREHVQYMYEAV